MFLTFILHDGLFYSISVHYKPVMMMTMTMHNVLYRGVVHALGERGSTPYGYTYYQITTPICKGHNNYKACKTVKSNDNLSYSLRR